MLTVIHAAGIFAGCAGSQGFALGAPGAVHAGFPSPATGYQ